jgi:hypothetical protein
VLSHRSAAYVWRLDGIGQHAPEPVEIVIPRGSARSTNARVRFTRSFERAIYRGLPVTPLSRTVVDLANVLEEAELEQALDSALRFGHRALSALRMKLSTLPKKGRPGLPLLRELVAAYDGSLDSALEVLVRKLLWAAGLPKPAVHYDVWHERQWIANVDFCWPKQKMLVQAHSIKWHLNARRFRVDQRQQSQLAAAGWLQLTTTWDEATKHPTRLIDCARTAWERAKVLPSGSARTVTGRFQTIIATGWIPSNGSRERAA